MSIYPIPIYRLRLINGFILALGLACLAFVQSDEGALREIVGKYFDAYAKKDWQAMEAIWHEASPFRGQRYQALERQFAGSELRFSAPVISHLKIEGDKASLRVSTRRTATRENSNTRMLTDVQAEMSFVREKGEWKLWNEVSPMAGLINTLAAANSDDERRRLLDADAELVTRDLLALLIGQSDRAYGMNDYPRATALLQGLILVSERLDNKTELSDAWHKLGIVYFLQKRYDEALAAYRKSLSLEEAAGRKYEIARALNSIGLLSLGHNKFAESLDHFQRALAIYESLNKKSDASQTVENIGNVHYEQGDDARAMEFYLRCVKLRDEDKKAVPAAYMVLKIARLELEQGHGVEALDYFRQAADRLAAAGDRRSLGYAFHNAANILYDQGDYNQALGFYQRSLQAERAAGTREGEAGALQGIGLIHSLNGNHALALQAHEQNLAVARALGDKKGLAVAWQKVAGSQFSLGKYEEALAAYQATLKLREQIADDQETAFALLDVGVTLAAKQDYPAALDYYTKSGELYTRLGNDAGVAATLINTALVYYQQNDFARSLEVAGQAAESAKRGQDFDLFWQARHRAGKASFRLDDLPAARQALAEAIATVETMRPPSSRSQQPRYFESKIAPYLAMVDVAISEGQGNEAFNFAERARARVLTGVLQNAKTRIVKTMTLREQERERQLLRDVTAFNAQMYREQERDKPNRTRIAELKAKFQKAQSEYADFRSRLYALHPQLKTLRGDAKPATVEQAASLIADAKTALLEFVETDEHIYLFVFTKDKAKSAKSSSKPAAAALRIFLLGTTRGDLFARIERFNQAIANRDPSFDAQAGELYDLLLKDARQVIEGKTQLMLIPDAITWGLPFQALRQSLRTEDGGDAQSGSGHFLIEDFAISYTPSLTVFSAVAGTRPGAVDRPPAPTRRRSAQSAALLAVANPALGQNATELLQTTLQIEHIAPLDEAEKEISALSKLFGTEQSLLLAGTEANKDRIKAEIGKHRFIHLATRGIHHEASPLFSLLAFAPDAEAREDGLLDLREILRLDVSAELIVQSASEWAKPRTLTGRAMTAWTWAWFVAGSPATLLSQWRSESAATTELMTAFYNQLKNPLMKSKAAAWQSAIKQLLNQEETRQPYFWAGFSMLGNGR